MPHPCACSGRHLQFINSIQFVKLVEHTIYERLIKFGAMKTAVTCCFVILLLILHQDYWQWERNDIVFGFLPYTMAYNIGISVATALLWVVVCAFLWPESDSQFDQGDRSDA